MRSAVWFLRKGDVPQGVLAPCPLPSGFPQRSAAANTAAGASFPSLLFSWWLQALTEHHEDISLRITLLSTLEMQS